MTANAAVPLDVPYFVSYAHDDDRLKAALLKKLETRLKIAKGYRFQAWDDRRLLVGEDWEAGIMAAVAACKFGLLLASPAFFASNFIRGTELPALVAEKRLVPVALRPLALDGSADLAGIEQLQIFPYPFGKPFSECSGDAARDRFADNLFKQIFQVVLRDIAPGRP